MPTIPISSLPNFDENKIGTWLVLNNSGETETFKIRRENFFTVKSYLNVQEMVSDLNISLNDYTETYGYHSPNDGGQLVYLIKSTGVPDGGSIIQLNNGLYAHAQLPSILSPIMWGGKVLDNSTSAATANVTAATAMFDFIAKENTTSNQNVIGRNSRKVRFPQNNYYVNGTMVLPSRNGYGIYDIDLNGCLIRALSAATDYAIFQRLKTTIDINTYGSIQVSSGVDYMNERILIYNGNIQGPNNNPGTIGIQIQCTYTSTISNINFSKLGTGLSVQFGLNTQIFSNMYNNCRYGTYLSSGLGFWAGATASNSQSNVSSLRHERHYCTYPSQAAIYIGGSSGVSVIDCIIEGGETVYGIQFNSNFSPNVTDFTVDRLHLEVADGGSAQGCTGAGIYLRQGGGQVNISGVYQQYSYSTFNEDKNDWTGTTNATPGTYVLSQTDGDFTTNGSGENLTFTVVVGGEGTITSWSLSGDPLSSSGYSENDIITIPAGALGENSTPAYIKVDRKDVDANGSIKAGNPLVDASASDNYCKINFHTLYWPGGTKLKGGRSGCFWNFSGEVPLPLIEFGNGSTVYPLSVDNEYWVAYLDESGNPSQLPVYRYYSDFVRGGRLGIGAPTTDARLGRTRIYPRPGNTEKFVSFIPDVLLLTQVGFAVDSPQSGFEVHTNAQLFLSENGNTVFTTNNGFIDLNPGNSKDIRLFNNAYRLPKLSGKTNTTIINNGLGTTSFGYLKGQTIEETILTNTSPQLQQLTSSFSLIPGASITFIATNTTHKLLVQAQTLCTSSHNNFFGLSNNTSTYTTLGAKYEKLVNVSSALQNNNVKWVITNLTVGQSYTINLAAKTTGGGQSFVVWGGNASGDYTDIIMTIEH
jgi:hypothetical protein